MIWTLHPNKDCCQALLRASEMVLWVKAPAAHPGDLILILGTHIVEEKHCGLHVCSGTNAHIQSKCKKKNKASQ